jgi:hypothetical protein
MTGMALTSLRGCPYPASIRMLQSFADVSWGNDVLDSLTFAIGGAGYILFVDTESREGRTREWGYSPLLPVSDANSLPPRYALHSLIWQGTLQDTLDDHVADDDLLLETEDPDALVAFLAGLL